MTFDTGWVNSLTYESPNLSGFTFSAQYAAKETTLSGAKDSYALSGSYNAGPLSVSLNYVAAGQTNTAPYYAEGDIVGFGASYDFGVAKVLGQYTQADYDGASEVGKSFEIGAVVPVSEAGAVLVAYGENKWGDWKHKVLSLAYDHKLSKRTDVYVGFKNDSETGEDSGQTFAVGIRHNF